MAIHRRMVVTSTFLYSDIIGDRSNVIISCTCNIIGDLFPRLTKIPFSMRVLINGPMPPVDKFRVAFFPVPPHEHGCIAQSGNKYHRAVDPNHKNRELIRMRIHAALNCKTSA